MCCVLADTYEMEDGVESYDTSLDLGADMNSKKVGFAQLDIVFERWIGLGHITVELHGREMAITKMENVVRATRKVVQCGTNCLRVQAALKPESDISVINTADGGAVEHAVRVRTLGSNVAVADVRCGVLPPSAPPSPPSPPPADPPMTPPDFWLLPHPPPAPPPESVARSAPIADCSGVMLIALAMVSGALPILGAVLIVRSVRRRQGRPQLGRPQPIKDYDDDDCYDDVEFDEDEVACGDEPNGPLDDASSGAEEVAEADEDDWRIPAVSAVPQRGALHGRPPLKVNDCKRMAKGHHTGARDGYRPTRSSRRRAEL